ncbi:MAG: T9SS type A sorting domain-containing protein [Flavobacteriales bacterium]|nr:T9SS type A sorting domain-containing protein [Flavobacteriales bacterium]
MKNLVAILLFFCSIALNAQISVNSTNYPEIGDQIIWDIDTSASSYTIGSAGTSQTYTFTSTDAHFSDTVDYVSATGTPYSSDFASSNLASFSDSIYTYYNKSSSILEIDGYNSVLPIINQNVVVNLSDVELIANFPINYNDLWTDYSNFDVTIAVTSLPVDSGRMVRWRQKTVNVDGAGQITTDYGTYDCLRQLVVTNTWDTIWTGINIPFVGMTWTQISASVSTDSSYEWISDHPNVDAPLVKAAVDAAGNILELEVNRMPLTTSLGETANKTFSIYPNPTEGQLFFSEVNTAYRYEVIDAQGRTVLNNRLNRNVALDLESGVYFIRILDEKGHAINQEKLVVK